VAEARRQSRYLAAHVSPTLAESPQYPQRLMLAGVAALFLGLTWAIGVLVIYSIRDRR
jgi:capsular polysaccharide transport system permease protein